MGCFPKCFTACKQRRNHKKSVAVTPFKHHQSPEATEEVVRIQPAESTKLQEEDSVKAIKPIKEESEEEIEKPSQNCAKKKVTFDLNVNACDEKENYKKEEATKEIEPILGSSVSSVLSTHPLKHRYENCQISDDEDEDVIDLEGSDLKDGDYESKRVSTQEESSESLFSLSIDSRKHYCDAETDEKEVNSPMPKQKVKPVGSNHCQSVLIPIENLTQWKEVKWKANPSQQQEKENIKMELDLNIPFSPEPTLKLSRQCTRPNGVDTSLSSWLVESETTAKSNASDKSVGNPQSSREDRPILGAWTSEELKQLSASSTPKRSRSPTPDEMPIIGTVGSYWSHTGQATDSDSGSSCRQKIAGRKREVQLERALEMGEL